MQSTCYIYCTGCLVIGVTAGITAGYQIQDLDRALQGAGQALRAVLTQSVSFSSA